MSLKSLCSCHVSSVIVHCTGNFESEDFISSLQKFVETATLGEFNARLEIIAAFLQDMIQKGARKINILTGSSIFCYVKVTLACPSCSKRWFCPVSSGSAEVGHPSHTFVFMDSVISFPLGATEGAVRCLGNTLMYYKQFSEAVEQAIQKLVAPVEKEFNVREPVICHAFFAPSVKSLAKHPSIIMRYVLRTA